MEPTYEQRLADARRRLRTALDPRSDQERAALGYLERWLGDLPTTETLALLAERAVRQATSTAYDRGWREGIEHRRQQR